VNAYAVIILVALLGEYALSVLSSALNLRSLSPTVPPEFADVFAADRYARSQEYTRSHTRFGLVRSSVSLGVVLTVWQLGGFDWLDQGVRGFGYGPIRTGLLYLGSIGLGSLLLGLPFRLYGTFVIEAQYGFNRMTLATFVADFLKSIVLSIVLGGALMTGVLFFFQWTGALAWFWCWIAATLFLLVVQFIAPTWIMPLFNTFEPLQDGSLRESIVSYARSVEFPLRDIFVVDGSKRSSKANAFFTGFGSNKRIGLFDTLIEKHSVPELVAVVAHEVGHYKKGHLLKNLVLQIGYLGALFFVLSLVLERQELFEAFSMTESSVHAGLVFFGLLFTPIDLALSMYVNAVSRKNEFEADAFAAQTTRHGEHLVAALKKLSADSLANLTPHPLDVFLRHSHPPVLQRITALRQVRS
jgi:STE24 endopeptidase